MENIKTFAFIFLPHCPPHFTIAFAGVDVVEEFLELGRHIAESWNLGTQYHSISGVPPQKKHDQPRLA